jgi:hypothetical protein
VKSAEPRWEAFGPATRRLVAELNSGPFLASLTALTGIEGLIADGTLTGGGQHQIARGGRLGVHADFPEHPENGLARRLNVIVYLNEDWQPEWGGALELWDADMARCVRRVQPELGRLVVFSTTRTAFHGHPDPLQCPEGVTRKSLALFYFTKDQPDGECLGDAHGTAFQVRPGSAQDRHDHLKTVLKPWIPPRFLEWRHHLLVRLGRR